MEESEEQDEIKLKGERELKERGGKLCKWNKVRIDTV